MIAEAAAETAAAAPNAPVCRAAEEGQGRR